MDILEVRRSEELNGVAGNTFQHHSVRAKSKLFRST
jgi:hypothetical protein